MGTTYFIFSIKSRGWANKTGTYGTSLEQAKPFTYAEAVTYCQKHTNFEGASDCIPVESSMILEINGAK